MVSCQVQLQQEDRPQRRSSLYDEENETDASFDAVSRQQQQQQQHVFHKASRRSSNPADSGTGSSSGSSSSGSSQGSFNDDDQVCIPLALEDLGLSEDAIAEIQDEDFGGEEERAFMEECTRLGISPELAEAAAKESRMAQSKWWSDMQQGQLDKKKLLNSNGQEVNMINSSDPLKGEELSVSNISMMSRPTQIHVSPQRRVSSNQPSQASVMHLVKVAKCEALGALKKSQGDTTNPRFKSALNALSAIYQGNGFNLASQKTQVLFEGVWTNISRPNFPNCLGNNKHGHFLYTLGRMSFDMFRPPNLRCSIQKVLCKTRSLDKDAGEAIPREVPSGLKQQILDLEASDQMSSIRTYDIEVFFTIEPRSIYETMALPDGSMEDMRNVRAPSVAIKAKMTSFGYLLPDPENPIRFTVWFTGGVVAPVPKDDPAAASTSKSSSSSKSKSKSSSGGSSAMRARARSSAGASNPRARRGGMGSLGALGEDEEAADMPTCAMTLQECRRRKKCCSIHGVDRVSTEEKKKFNKWNERYARPSQGLYSKAGKTNDFLTGPSTLTKAVSPFSAEWEDLFAPEENWRLSFGDKAKGLAIKLLMGATLPTGMEDDGTMEFTLGRPIGGHGTTFIDVLYMDENLRVLKGNAGTIFVQAREGMEKEALSAKMEKEELKRVPVKELEPDKPDQELRASASRECAQPEMDDEEMEAREHAERRARRGGSSGRPEKPGRSSSKPSSSSGGSRARQGMRGERQGMRGDRRRGPEAEQACAEPQEEESPEQEESQSPVRRTSLSSARRRGSNNSVGSAAGNMVHNVLHAIQGSGANNGSQRSIGSNASRGSATQGRRGSTASSRMRRNDSNTSLSSASAA